MCGYREAMMPIKDVQKLNEAQDAVYAATNPQMKST